MAVPGEHGVWVVCQVDVTAAMNAIEVLAEIARLFESKVHTLD